MIMYGPNGICEDIDFVFFNKLGITLNKAIIDDKNIRQYLIFEHLNIFKEIVLGTVCH